MESPFAKAMQAASHVLVIPNHSVGIYTRHLDKTNVETSMMKELAAVVIEQAAGSMCLSSLQSSLSLIRVCCIVI